MKVALTKRRILDKNEEAVASQLMLLTIHLDVVRALVICIWPW